MDDFGTDWFFTLNSCTYTKITFISLYPNIAIKIYPVFYFIEGRFGIVRSYVAGMNENRIKLVFLMRQWNWRGVYNLMKHAKRVVICRWRNNGLAWELITDMAGVTGFTRKHNIRCCWNKRPCMEIYNP